MPDITMCHGFNEANKVACPKKHTCYRYTANPSGFRQSYFTEAPFNFNKIETQCQYYWPVESQQTKSQK
jgi:hypothetical protein